MQDYFIYCFVFIVGTIIGSFLNVVIYRIPRNKSIIKPGSHCPKCGIVIPFLYNIPVISYLLLKGKCKDCGAKIPISYFLIEILTALVFVILYFALGLTINMVKFAVLFSVLISVSFIDTNMKIIPDKILITGFLIGLNISLYESFDSFVIFFFGLLLGGGILYFFWFLGKILFKEDGIGGGDIKLVAVIGAFLGWKLLLLSIFISFFSVFVYGITGMILKRIDRKTRIPLAPFITIGVFTTLMAGEQIIQWYIDLIRYL